MWEALSYIDQHGARSKTGKSLAANGADSTKSNTESSTPVV